MLNGHLRFGWHLLLLIAIFGCLLQAALPDTPLKPQGKLEVRLDHALAKQEGNNRDEGSRRWIFSSYLEFNKPVADFSDAQLLQLAIDAHKEMVEDWTQYKLKSRIVKGKEIIKSLPFVMTIMAFDNYIILGSSQKGKSGFIDSFPDSPVKQILDLCSLEFRDQDPPPLPENADHMNDRKCGEVSVFHHYYQVHTKVIKDLDPTARVTSVGGGRKGSAKHKDPWGSDTKMKWGCNRLVREIGVDYLMSDVGQKTYDLSTIAGGIKRIGQIQSCAKEVKWSSTVFGEAGSA